MGFFHIGQRGNRAVLGVFLGRHHQLAREGARQHGDDRGAYLGRDLVRVAQVAAALSISTRTLEMVFRDLAGTTLVDADAYGKHLFVRFDDGSSLHVHLLMQGRIRFGRVDGIPEWRRRFELVLDTASGRRSVVGVDVPLLHLLSTGDEAAFVGHLGPDVCAPGGVDLDVDSAASTSAAHRGNRAPIAADLGRLRHDAERVIAPLASNRDGEVYSGAVQGTDPDDLAACDGRRAAHPGMGRT